MIVQPSIAQMLRSVSHDLRKVIEPALSDKSAAVMVQMMAAVLDAMALRCENEHRWIAEESEAIRSVAKSFLMSEPRNQELQEASHALQAASFTDDAMTHYEKASELLSCTIEAAMHARLPQAQAAIEALLNQRLAHEIEVIGENFQPIGRS